METRLPWRPTRGSLTSPSYLVRNRTLGPPLENHPETPPSSRRWGPSSPAWPRGQPRDLSPNASGGLTPFSPPSELQAIRDTRRDSRAERGSLLPLEMEACLPGCVWNATPRSLSPLERNIGFWTQA